MIKAIIVTIGDEILLGQILDTNSKFIARQLTSIGIEVNEVCSIPDKEEKIRMKIEYVLNVSDLVIVTGGLGPTKDDVTKQVLADYFGMQLIENKDVLEQLERLFANGGMRMNERNQGQAMIPDGCRILMNRKGTAPGMWFEKKGKVLVSLPGVPCEMEDLMICEVIPMLSRRYSDMLLEYRMLKVYNIVESELAMRLEVWESKLPEGLSLAYLPSPGVVKLRLTARGVSNLLLERWFTNLQKELVGVRFVIGENATLEQLLANMLLTKHLTVATAESCTGGNIAALLSSIPGASRYFKGGVVAYATSVKKDVLQVIDKDIKEYGVVSEVVVRQMAERVRCLMNVDYAISTSGIVGPTGGTLENPVGTVWIAVASSEETIARSFTFGFTRKTNMAKASLEAIEMLMELMENEGKRMRD